MSDENQHWVSKFLVKNFVDRDGRVYSMDIHTGEIRKPPPKYAAARKGFNEFTIGGRKASFEDRLEAVETAAAPVLQQIATSRSTGWLSLEQKNRLAKFMAAQSFRTEAFFMGMNATLARQEFGSIFSELWRGSFIAANELVRRHWIVMLIEHDDVFYLGDHPLVLQNTERPSDAGTLGFDIKGVEAFLPLSPRCALYMPCRTTSEEIRSGYEKALRTHQTMRSTAIRAIRSPGYSSDYLHLVQRVIGNSHSLYRAITEGTPVIAKQENVENLNYLQCAWSHTNAYSNRKDSLSRSAFLERIHNIEKCCELVLNLNGLTRFGAKPLLHRADARTAIALWDLQRTLRARGYGAKERRIIAFSSWFSSSQKWRSSFPCRRP
jgi:hypothetical protein